MTVRPHMPFGLRVTEGPVPASLGAEFDVPPGRVASDGTRALVHGSADWALLVEGGVDVTVSWRGAGPVPNWVVDSWAVSIAMMQRGLLALHATVVEVGGRAVAIAGVSGAGKTTTAAALHLAGERLLIDDVAVIDLSGDAPEVLTYRRPALLTDDSAERLGIDAAALAQDSGSSKSRWQFDGGHSGTVGRLPLAAIVVLERGPGSADTGPRADGQEPAAVQAHRLTGAHKMSAVIEHAGRPDTARRILGPDRFMQAIAELCNSLDVWHITRPAHGSTVDQVVDAVRRAAGMGSLPEVFARVAAAHADDVALCSPAGTVTYSQLHAMVEATADALAACPAPDRPVPVLATHGAPTIAGLLATATAGRVALVLDPHDPDAHLGRVISRFGGGPLVTDAAQAERAHGLQTGTETVLVSDGTSTAEPHRGPRPVVDTSAPATASLTSATTGEAKAVVHPHRNVVTNAVRYAMAHGITSDDRILVIGPLGAQAAATQIFSALLSGATLLTYDIRTLGAQRLASFAQANGATTLHLPPAVVGSLPADLRLPAIRLVSLGGDRATRHHLDRVRTMFPNATLLQRYSTSETNTIAGWRLAPDDPLPEHGLPALEPAPWAGVRVVGDDGRPVAVGDIGEVEVTGSHVALGYLDDPVRTAERFTDLGPVRTYRTGDRARLLPDGRLELVGRVDDVCKVRGVLVDPAAVERVLETMPAVTAAAVVSRVVGGRTDLVAFVVPADRTVHGWQLRAALSQRVPPALVPASVRIIDALPTTARNKIDRSALRALAVEGVSRSMPSSDDETPVGDLEQRIASVFADVLGAGPIGTFGRHDDVFEVGADSLAVIEILTRLERVLDRRVEASALLGAPTPARLAARLHDSSPDRIIDGLVRLRTGDADRVPVVVFTGGGGAHLSGPALLAQRLDRRTTYAVIPRGFEQRARADRTLAAMGARSAAALCALAHERIVIVGHSSGGNVAIETARQLFGGPVQVDVVVLLDSLAMTPHVIQRRRFRAWLRWELDNERRAAGERSRTAALSAGVRVTTGFVVKRMQQSWRATTAGLLPRKGAAQHMAYEAVVRRALRRRPERPYPGSVVVVRADRDAWSDLPDDLRWSEVELGSLGVDHVDAPHSAMLTAPYVDDTATAVERACRRVSS